DGLLAAAAGATYRTGREARSEFNEQYAPEKADGWQMGASILLHGRDMGRPIPYTPPSFAIKYDPSKANKRTIKTFEDGYWWVELGSDDDIIADYETIRHKLLGYAHGVWDYIKNSGKYPEAANYALEWIGSLPGRRESRRFIGDYILSERDLVENRHFHDAVAYGGWSLDEHCPGGIENPDDPPSFFHYHFDEVYEIPFRCLYSRDLRNLLFAGRNISQTHIALSSTRVMATCAVMGQAVGTAAALCMRHETFPRELAKTHINELQEQLLRDDAFIPNRPSRDPLDLARKATAIFADSTTSGDAANLTDGMSRDFKGKIHHWQSDGLPAEVQLEWESPVALSRIDIKCDTNVHRDFMLRKTPRANHIRGVPPELMKSLAADVRVDGRWVEVGARDENQTRLVRFTFDQVRATAVRIRLKETYGHPHAKLFEIRCYENP
ncbi:MAG: FAD-dependent oxidoreductase, partial [Planctomycetota bacterium]